MNCHASHIQSWDADAVTGSSGHLTIDLAALQRNYRKLSAAVAPASAAAVVKADAYGLGAEQVSKALHAQGCRHFFVAHLPEALKLRPLLPNDTHIFVLNGLQPGAEITCTNADVVPVLNSLEQFRRWSFTAEKLGRVFLPFCSSTLACRVSAYLHRKEPRSPPNSRAAGTSKSSSS